VALMFGIRIRNMAETERDPGITVTSTTRHFSVRLVTYTGRKGLEYVPNPFTRFEFRR
jgi:hypothetical protein